MATPLLKNTWLFTSPLRILRQLLTILSPLDLRLWSFRFSPPRCYQASLAGTSSLLRAHLPPHTLPKLELPLVSIALPYRPRGGVRLPPLLQAPCKQLHPTTHHRSDRVSDFALFRRLAAPVVPLRFTCVMCRLLPMASFRPHRYQ